ncbi:AMP-binding protein [Bradyrhizobium sp. NP1]|uniref:class I adenylate-forming enzyme family protein n=1 Tax=Bradyrhizobium sp. NP1 TaxID=3049772 RepID=UPI0025A68508|nr:AMP-binding protein [Bradyrhizobium sp. NP1]WJR75831.1 AMP-binding protein [Bradyrhizobium sp. NP1]
MNVSDLLGDVASYYAGKPLLYVRGEPISHARIDADVRKLTGWLRSRGIARGDRVLLVMNNSAEWLVSLFAILRVGAIVVPVNPGLKSAEMCTIATHCEPSMAIVDDEFVEYLEPLADRFPMLVRAGSGPCDWTAVVVGAEADREATQVNASDASMIFYTSGTTGAPKGVIISHGAVNYIATMTSTHMRIGRADTSLVMGSLAFIYPLAINCLASFRGGATVVLQERFHPKFVCEAVEMRRVTVTMGVPTMFVMLMNFGELEQYDFSSMRLAISGGASLPDALCRRAKDTLGFEIFDLWGMTECTPVTSYDPARDDRGVPDSCGRALPGCDFRIVDDNLRPVANGVVGEVMLTGPMIMSGYYKNPKATAETMIDGWIRSGDLGIRDDAGHLFLVGRRKDLIIRGGANVYPVEIEEVLYTHPDVAECAVIGLPDAVFGERVKAFVVRRTDRLIEQELLSHCSRTLAEYKLPSEIEFVAELPKGPTGKILRRELRDLSTVRAERSPSKDQGLQ